MATKEYDIYFSTTEDGTFLAVSLAAPRFCLGAKTAEEVRAKAYAALDYFEGTKGKVTFPPARTPKVISPVFEAERLIA